MHKLTSILVDKSTPGRLQSGHSIKNQANWRQENGNGAEAAQVQVEAGGHSKLRVLVLDVQVCINIQAEQTRQCDLALL